MQYQEYNLFIWLCHFEKPLILIKIIFIPTTFGVLSLHTINNAVNLKYSNLRCFKISDSVQFYNCSSGSLYLMNMFKGIFAFWITSFIPNNKWKYFVMTSVFFRKVYLYFSRNILALFWCCLLWVANFLFHKIFTLNNKMF